MRPELGRPAGLPTFLGLGVLKAGTTTLHDWLDQHPEVSTPRDRKEVDFFSRHFDRGLPWYLDLFTDDPWRARGEFSVSYLHDPVALRRITSAIPDVRCVVSLRDPMARLESQHRHFAMVTGYAGSFEEFVVEHLHAVERSLYADQLARLFELVPPERVSVMVLEEFTRCPAEAASGLYRFLGVDPDFEPIGQSTPRNETMLPRWRTAAAARRVVGRYAQRHDARWLTRVGRSSVADRMFFTPRPSGATTREDGRGGRGGPERDRLQRRFAEDVARTSLMLDRDLTEIWPRT